MNRRTVDEGGMKEDWRKGRTMAGKGSGGRGVER